MDIEASIAQPGKAFTRNLFGSIALMVVPVLLYYFVFTPGDSTVSLWPLLLIAGIAYGYMLSIPKQAKKNRQVLRRLVMDPSYSPKTVKVLLPTPKQKYRTTSLKAPGFRLAEDDSGRRYLVFYAERLNETFQARLYDLSHGTTPFLNFQRYAVIPVDK